MHDDPFDRGLRNDLDELSQRTFNRRWLLRMSLGAGLATWLGCKQKDGTENGDGETAGSSGGENNDSGSAGSSSATCARIPEETAGPYPGDGSNGPNVLELGGIVRKDIRASFAGASGTADGVALTIRLRVVDVADGCTPLAGFAVYAWHCDRAGLYSLYSAGATEQNYLRGVQETDDDGVVEFTSIFPACYTGRWPHVHFEIFPSLDAATDVNAKVATSQLAFPEDVCTTVFAQSGYEQSVRNLAQLTLASDNVFRDGAEQQLATMSGDVSDGYEAELTVAIAT